MTNSNPLSPDPQDADASLEVNVEETPEAKGSRLISRLLPPAIRLWIQRQVDHIEGLDFRLEAKDRQVLSGYVPRVSVVAHKAIYQGIHISSVAVAASEIRVNLRQVLRGKPLRLLKSFPVAGDVVLSAEDLDVSLSSDLLAQGLRDVLQRIVAAQTHQVADATVIECLQNASPTDATTTLTDNQLTLSWPSAQAEETRISLRTGLVVRDHHWLWLTEPAVAIEGGNAEAESWVKLDDVAIDLGPQVEIRQLTVNPDGIELQGAITVIPGDD
jgi:hypothetical protein